MPNEQAGLQSNGREGKPGETMRLATFLASTSFRDLPSEVVSRAKILLLDLLGGILGANNTPEARMAAELVRELGGTKECSAFGFGFRTNSQNAAFLNSLASHVLELDDTHLESLTHVGAAVIPAALAMAERQRSSGATAIAAIVLGYEACLRVANAVQPSHWHKGFLSMGTCGTFGAAAAASHCLGLHADTLANAFGLAGMQSASTNSSSYGKGDMGRRLSPSHAAGAGVVAALLAQKGFTGSTNIFEGRNGFCQVFSDRSDLSRITEALGDHYLIMRTGLKPYSCNRLGHASIDGFTQILADQRFDPACVQSVRVRTFDAAVSGRPNRTAPETLFDAKMSIPFSLAVAAYEGGAGHREFREDLLKDAKLQRFAAKVLIESDSELTAMFPRQWPARVTVTLQDGRVFEKFVPYPKGEPEAPLTDEEVDRKFLDLATLTVSDSVARAIVEEVRALDRRESLIRLTDLLRADSANSPQ